ncbi:hypothetical protein GE21DRAFT_1251954 [Neurospora crassa]|nr:hypothetical protein B2O8.90 [imported] - Neurospora crassa [Neurospora crassa]KHE87107.1 hypothetical protein GE21DRAFT_1251954 [Neurospora crassa]
MCTHTISRILCPRCCLSVTRTFTSESKCPSAAALDDGRYDTSVPKEHCLKWTNREIRIFGQEPCHNCKDQQERVSALVGGDEGNEGSEGSKAGKGNDGSKAGEEGEGVKGG